MSSRLLRIAALFVALSTAIAVLQTGAEASPPESGEEQVPFVENETPDDPPAATRARDDDDARSPAPSVVRGTYVSIQVNVDGLGQNIVGDAANEPSIAVSLTDPDNMVVGWRQFDSISSNFRQAGWAYTFDGGQSWTFTDVIQPGVFRSDPVLESDRDGNIYYQSLTSSFALDLFRSTNGGIGWGAGTPSFGGDKNWMAIDKTAGVGSGNIYGIWQRFAGCCGIDVLTRSTDGGLLFEEPVSVTNSPTFGTLAVGPDGALYSAGIDGSVTQDFSTFVMARSATAQNPDVTPTFTGRVVDLGGSMRAGTGPNPSGLLGQAGIEVNPAPGPLNGHVYMLASVDPPGPDPLDVHFVRSLNDGLTWSAPRRINDDPSTSNWQWFGALSVASTGRIDAIWYDTRSSAQSNVSEMFYSYSYDSGFTWSPNVAVTPPFNSFLGWPQQNKLGDYIQLRSDVSGADVAYAATFNGEQDVYYVRLFPDCNTNAVSDVIDIGSGVSADCNEDLIPDECQTNIPCAGAGSVPDGRIIPGDLLRLGRTGSDQVELSWGVSCFGGDTDYEVYEGADFEQFANHSPLLCTTEGNNSATVLPGDGARYYLVVPFSSVEGSYGRDSEGAERAQGSVSCREQSIVSCLTSLP